MRSSATPCTNCSEKFYTRSKLYF
uniref:Uncharacterized protein n=1 Tax=Macrostomum lignano TaxID=282301 RepID=A0A1I8F3V6_9PLAT